MPGFLTVWEKNRTAFRCPLTADKRTHQISFACAWAFSSFLTILTELRLDASQTMMSNSFRSPIKPHEDKFLCELDISNSRFCKG